MRALIFLLILMVPFVAVAQDTPPAPQLLYRDGGGLFLLDGYTGETIALPIEVGERDRVEWSPDGVHLLVARQMDMGGPYCIRLYDVEAERWTTNEPIACDVRSRWVFVETADVLY
ncbi:MAG: hypothetical protein AAF125_13640, partial [Chloroflexota bacterium]